MQNEKINPEQAYQVLAITWLTFLISQFLFLVVLFFIKPNVFDFDFSKPLLGANAPIVIALGLVGPTTFGLSFVISRKYLRKAEAEQNVGMVQSATIIGSALCESISLLGLVLAFAFSYQYFFLWFALGIVGTLLHFPRRDHIIAASYKK